MSGKIQFISDEKQSEYDRQGVILTPMLDTGGIDRLRSLFSMYFDLSELPSVYDTIAFSSPEVISAVNAGIKEICGPDLQRVIKGYKVACSIFFIKKPGDDSHLALHLDPSLTSSSHSALAIWIPLCDIDHSTGRFCVLENSEHFLPPYSTPSIPSSYAAVEDMLDSHLTCFSMKAGEAIIMNNGLLHCTLKNTSDTTRLAVVLKVIDESAPLVTGYYDDSAEDGKKVSLYRQSDDFFTTGAFRSPLPPPHAEFVSHVPGLPRVFDSQEILDLLKRYPPAYRSV